MSRARRLIWRLPDGPTPKRPYRDTVIVYGALAIVIVLIAWVTGGDVRKAVWVALVAFAGASLWGIAMWHRRLRREARERGAARREP